MRGNTGKGKEDNESRNENAVYNIMIAAALVIACFGDG
jgi:hypothetical protein